MWGFLKQLLEPKKQRPSEEILATRRTHLQELAKSLGFPDARIAETRYGPKFEIDGGRMHIEISEQQFRRFLETKKPTELCVRHGSVDDCGERCQLRVEIEPNTDLLCFGYAHMHFDAGILDKTPYKRTTEKRGPLGNICESIYQRQE